MYLRKILTDGNKEFLENMRVDFDYKGEHYNVRIKRLCDNFFESYTGLVLIIAKFVTARLDI